MARHAAASFCSGFAIAPIAPLPALVFFRVTRLDSGAILGVLVVSWSAGAVFFRAMMASDVVIKMRCKGCARERASAARQDSPAALPAGC